jgi:hypothetical protein
MAQKKPDPISDKARALEAEIQKLESEIKKLDTQISRTSVPKFRSTATPSGATIPHAPEKIVPPKPAEPVFEEVKGTPLQPRDESDAPDYYNELGVRKYDLPALWQRIRNHFRGPTTSNPRLVNYLAAGGVQGLKPLRYEKRVARNRVLVLAAVFFLLMLGTLLLWLKHR